MFCYYILPSLSGILKVRKYKLTQKTSNFDSNLTDTSSNIFEFLIQDVVKLVNVNLSSFESGSTNFVATNSTLLEFPIYRHLTIRSFSSKVASNIQIPAFLLSKRINGETKK